MGSDTRHKWLRVRGNGTTRALFPTEGSQWPPAVSAHRSRSVESRTATEETSMKHLLTGVAVAAALAIAAPAWAQTTAPMTPPPAKTAPAKPMAKKPMHHVMYKHKGMMGGDQMTE